MIYKISLPIKVSYEVDINDLLIEDIEDVEYLQEKYDVDLQYIIDEYDYKVEAELRYFDDEDDYQDELSSLTRHELLQNVIDDNINNILSKFNKQYKLSALDKETLTKIFTTTQDDFKSNFILNAQPDQYTINSVHISDYNAPESYFIIDVDVNKELTDIELTELKSIIDHKCSDEWGSKFEKNDLADVIEEEMMYVYVKCWDVNKPIDFI